MRLLLAEDEKALSNALVALLKHAGYSVDAVYNGADAVDYLESGVYDGAILDIMMPKVDGITALKTIRAKGNAVPVLLLTARTETDDKVEGLDAGADDYLTKPFNAKELLARVRAVTRRQREPIDDLITCGNVSLDRKTCELISDKGRVQLTAKEFQLTELFMRNPSQVFSVDAIMEKVWGYDSEAEINAVWTYVSFIRKKLKVLGADVNIKAIRNLGYKLEVDK